MRVTLVPTWLQEFEKEARYNMNWKRWLKFGPYKKLWSLVGGRPWTYIYRDIWHKVEWFAQMQWLFTGAIGYALGGWKGLLIFTAIYTYGYVNGHFFWGKKYIPGQKGG